MFVSRIASPKGLVFAALVGAVALLPVTAAAQTKIVDELKVGGLAHDVRFLGRHVEGGADVNVELLFTSPDLLRYIGSPRPHIGADINTSGNTSDGYFGLTWGIMLIQNLFGAGDGVFANGSLGGAVHDGYLLTRPAGPQAAGIAHPVPRKPGTRLPSEPGGQRLRDSRPHLQRQSGAHNAGITSAGARIGFRF